MATLLDSSLGGNIKPSKLDKRSYQYYRLPNGLKVLIIIDYRNYWNDEMLSGAVMSVDTGLWDDPVDSIGLSNLLEHVLRYDRNNSPHGVNFFNYVDTNGGDWHASTSPEETKYSFRIPADNFKYALKLFTQIFINSALDYATILDELQNIHEEYESERHCFEKKFIQLLTHVSNREHPFHSFQGYSDTLNKSDIRDQLLHFYHRRYSADKMNLVVYTTKPFFNWKDFIASIFSRIPYTRAEPINANNILPFDDHMGRILVMKCSPCTHTLAMIWQIPSSQFNPKHAMDKFLIYHILAHQGKGSIYNYLLMQSLATDVEVDIILSSESFHLLAIFVMVNENGLQNTAFIVKSVFKVLNVLKKMTKYEFNKLWTEFIEIEKLLFDWKQPEGMLKYLDLLASRMRLYKNSSYFIDNPYYYTPSFKQIQNVLDSMAPDKSLIIVSSSKVIVSPKLEIRNDFKMVPNDVIAFDHHAIPIPLLDFEEPHYNTPFTIYEIPDMLKDQWSHVRFSPKFHLPLRNEFIPNDEYFKKAKIHNFRTPQLINTKPGVSMWYLPKKSSVGSFMNLKCLLKRKNLVTTARQMLLTRVYIELVQHKLNSVWYSAERINYRISFEYNIDSIAFEVNGFPDVLVISKLINLSFRTLINHGDILRDSVAFDRVMYRIRNEHLEHQSLTSYTNYLLRVLLWRPHWNNEQILQHIDGIELNEVLNYGKLKMLYDLNLECLVGGDIEQDKAGNVYELENSFKYSTSSLIDTVHLYILEQLIWNECLDQLHSSINKLSHNIDCAVDVDGSIGSFTVTIQSETLAPKDLLESINTFLLSYFNDVIVSPIFEELLNKTIHAANENRLPTDLNFEETWIEICSGNHQFDVKKQELDVFNKVTSDSFQRFYYDTIINHNMWRKLILVVYRSGQFSQLDVDCTVIYTNIDQSIHDLESACKWKL